MPDYTVDSYNSKILAIKCQKCGAGKLQRCKPANGFGDIKISRPHKIRVDQAKEVSNDGQQDNLRSSS